MEKSTFFGQKIYENIFENYKKELKTVLYGKTGGGTNASRIKSFFKSMGGIVSFAIFEATRAAIRILFTALKLLSYAVVPLIVTIPFMMILTKAMVGINKFSEKMYKKIGLVDENFKSNRGPIRKRRHVKRTD